MAAQTIARFGRVNVLMANAGVYVPGEAAKGDPDAWDNMIAVNVNSVFRSVRAVLPAMIAQGVGRHYRHQLHFWPSSHAMGASLQRD